MALSFLFSQGGSDQLKAGEISLIETTPEEAEAAKARLDATRKKRREHWNKNAEAINTKRRKKKTQSE